MINYYNLIKYTQLFDQNIPCKECIIKFLCSEPCISWENRINEWEKEEWNKCMDYMKERIENEKRSL
jgi:endoglucanase Acf2